MVPWDWEEAGVRVPRCRRSYLSRGARDRRSSHVMRGRRIDCRAETVEEAAERMKRRGTSGSGDQ